MKTDIKIQFILYSDGPSHKYLGINPVLGLKKLYYNAEFFWVKKNCGILIDKPDYVFCLKPRENDELILQLKSKGAKICLIANDELISNERIQFFDFVVSPSIGWLKTYKKPTFLIKEEFNYHQIKTHIDSFKLVTFGFKENLVKHLTSVLEKLKNYDITIVSNFDDKKSLPKIFYEFNLVKFKNYDYFDPEFDMKIIRQFEDYDVGLITQYKSSGRTTNRIKILLYSGLPVITNQDEIEQLWFDNNKIFLNCVYQEMWIDEIEKLKDKKIRQSITNNNFNIIEKCYNIEQTAKSFLDAIKKFENLNLEKKYE